MNVELQKIVNICYDSDMYPEVLKACYSLLKDTEALNCEIRYALSKNEKCPLEILEKLIKDSEDNIRINAAKHVYATEKMLACCVKDDNSEVKLSAISNHNVTEDILIALLKDKDDEVVQLARKTLKERL